MKLKIFLFSSVVLFLITCTKVKGPAPVSTAIPLGACDTAYWYNGHIEPIIKANCATVDGCHGPNASGIPYTTYAGVKYDVDNGTFNERVFVIKDMPKGGVLSAHDAERISCWLSKGAPENEIGGSVTPPPTGNSCSTTISYSSTIAPIMTTNCNTSIGAAGCHQSGSLNGDFTSYSGLSAKVTNQSLNNRVVVVKDMATFPNLATPLSITDIKNIDCWIQQGGANN